MTNGFKLSLFSGAALLALSLATPASAAPSGSYQQSCRNIEQHYGKTLTAECRTRDGSWVDTRLDSTDCSGDIANMNGRLVCNDNQADRSDRAHDDGSRYGDNNRDGNDRQADRGDRHDNNDAYAGTPSYGESYGDRRDNDRGWGHETLSRWQLVRRLDRQGYASARDLQQMRNSDDWRATAWYHGRRVVVRLNPRNGRVLSARYI